ncbi:MAG: UDP-N-acetylmuramate--L-alanine ligase [Alphaproteobacteria bacterium]|nr:UDP-N-acetylmuramate--L-alanine ligase [Alphaproteobacteria bacterium]
MTRRLSINIGTLHFIGIGGIGMSGIAELMHRLGYRISGSDQSKNANVQRLRDLGVVVHHGHAPEHLHGVDYVVRSTAVKADNPEIIAARAAGIPIVHRAEMLGEMMLLKNTIAVAGTHGKTTTTSLIAHVLAHAHLDPTVINGGVINQFGSNALVGGGEWMVVEADESDGSFVKLPHVAGVITNINAEHFDYYSDFDGIRAAFARFIDNVPFFGFAVMCTDHPEVQALLKQLKDRRVISYGLNPHAEVRADNVRMDGEVQCFDVHFQPCHIEDAESSVAVRLHLPGDHNICNALAAIAVARELRIPARDIATGIESFGGVRRRFQRTGNVRGVAIIDDYAHHPVEIQAVLSAAQRMNFRRLIVLFQPHRYSRFRALYGDFLSVFAKTETLLVLPVYAAGETAIAECTYDIFAADMIRLGHQDVVAMTDDVAALACAVESRMQDGDLVLCLGAGSITTIAHELPSALEALRGDS